MPKKKLILLILVAILMAFAASAVANRMMDNKLNDGDNAEESNSVPVVVTTADIAYGQILSEENLQLKILPKDLVTPGSMNSIADAIGKVAKGEIFKGEALLDKRLTDKEGSTILAALVNKDMRAVSIRVNDVIGVAGFLLPGNRVDVLASRMEERRSITRTVLENIKVLAVDQTAEASKDKPLLVQAVTVEVSPADSEKLFQAIQEGSIHLTLRNPVDSSEQQTVAPSLQPEQLAITPPLQPEQQLALIPESETPAPVKIKKKSGQAKKKAYRKRKKRTQRKQLAKQEITPEIGYQPSATEQQYIEQAVFEQPVAKIISAPKPMLTSTITVIRGVTQQEVTMIKKGFTNDGRSGIFDSN